MPERAARNGGTLHFQSMILRFTTLPPVARRVAVVAREASD